ncbi:MAG: DMT family transporter [Gemmatimonadota bacterium]
MQRASDIRAGFLLALVSASAFGALPILGKFAFEEGFQVATLLAWRFGLAVALIWAVVAAAPAVGPRGAAAIGGRRRLALICLGVLYAVNSALYFLALERIPATTTSLLFYVYPALVALLGIALLRHSPRPMKLVALGTSLLGVLLTVGLSRAGLDPAGIALARGSAAVVALYFILAELALTGLPTLPATALVLTGTVLAYAGWLAASGAPALPPSAAGWRLVAAMAAFCTVLSLLAMLGALRRVGAGTTSIVSTLEPAVTVLLAAAILGERLALRQLAGGALILAGVAVLRLATRRPAPALVDA